MPIVSYIITSFNLNPPPVDLAFLLPLFFKRKEKRIGVTQIYDACKSITASIVSDVTIEDV